MLYSFGSQLGDGEEPTAGLVQATDSNFYGTTYSGGTNDGGTIFKITPGGKLTTLYSFCSQSNCTDGEEPTAGLVQATDSNFYGTTQFGGAKDHGTVFEITPGGKLTVLYSFDSQLGFTDGATPLAGLVQATDGNFYGTTYRTGFRGPGTIFEITPAGELTTLSSFCSQSHCTNGQNPAAALVQATNGNFYGTTQYGGADHAGTVFSLATGLRPFVTTLPTSGRVGRGVRILGNNLTSATSVTFNGVPANFTVVSNTNIATTVPSDATTGKVVVTTPGDSLTSNVDFQVR